MIASGAREILEEYWKSIGGKPVAGAAKPDQNKKRGRQSTGSAKPDTSKRPKMSKSKRKSNGAMEQDTSPAPLTGYTEEGDDAWRAPTPKDGAWDPLVQSVDTVVRENADGELWGYLIWNEKNDDGRFYRSKAKLPTIYRACPQRVRSAYLLDLNGKPANSSFRCCISTRSICERFLNAEQTRWMLTFLQRILDQYQRYSS